MTYRTILAIATTTLLTLSATALLAAGTPSTDKDKFSYSVGTMFGKQLQQRFSQQQEDIDLDMMLDALNDAFRGNDLKMTTEEMQAALKLADEKKKVAAEKASTENLKQGNDWLATNKGKEGVKTTDSGLQYKIIKAGSGKQPTKNDTVEVHYRGTLIDGTEFDSSYKRGEPATFPVKGVIAGWTEGLQLMKEGGKMEFYIPAELAYGKRGAGGNIGPNSALQFEVELLSVKAP